MITKKELVKRISTLEKEMKEHRHDSDSIDHSCHSTSSYWNFFGMLYEKHTVPMSEVVNKMAEFCGVDLRIKQPTSAELTIEKKVEKPGKKRGKK